LLEELKEELTNATDIKQVEAINGRILIESTEIQAQQAQATNLVAMTTAQTQINHENEEQRIRQEYQQTAARYATAEQ
ncbi:MAG: type IV secretion system protein, partial [Janthinobacterium lividum]